jgi:hypothetical protein
MNCHVCGKIAIHHVTEIINGKPAEVHVCEAHLAEAGSPKYPPAPPTQRSLLAEIWSDASFRYALQDAVSREMLIAYLLPPLCEALRDRHPEVRLRAAFMLASLGIDAESAHGALRDALADENLLVRKVAAAAIEQIQIESKMHPSQRRYRTVVV